MKGRIQIVGLGLFDFFYIQPSSASVLLTHNYVKSIKRNVAINWEILGLCIGQKFFVFAGFS
jgi:hypothetical protein